MNGFEILPSAGGGSDPLKLDLAGGTMTGQLVLQLASATGALNVSPVWNNGATTFAGIYGRVTNTASGANSKLIDLGTVADGSLFSVSKAGAVNARGFYWIASTTYGFDDATGWGIGWKSNGDTVAIVVSNVGQNQLVLQGAGSVGFSGANYPFADTALFRSASGRMALRNNIGYVGSLYPSVIAQAFEVYNTYTSATNYERAVIDWQTTSNTLRIGTEKGSGGGSARGMDFIVDGIARMGISSAGKTLIYSLPTSNPGPGILWNNAGTPAIGT